MKTGAGRQESNGGWGGRFLTSVFCLLTSIVLLLTAESWGAEGKPRAAFVPLGGEASAEVRERIGFSLRAKLERTGAYEVIDGPMMNDLLRDSGEPITFSTAADRVKELAKPLEATVLVWGEVNPVAEGTKLQLKLLDGRNLEAGVRSIEKLIKEPTDVRFVSEQVLEMLAGVGAFEHPSETAVQRDAEAEKLWQANPNLVVNGDFSRDGSWEAIYLAEKYPVRQSPRLPDVDQVNIYRMPLGRKEFKAVLAMNLSRQCAENNGMACLSAPIPIRPNTRYRLSFRYESDGPRLHVFVKGYTTGTDINGQKTEREIYRRQVPPSDATDGKWVEIVDELNPQHVALPVEHLRIDLYAYLKPGTVLFADVVLKAVGNQNRQAKDPAIKPPVTRPATQGH